MITKRRPRVTDLERRLLALLERSNTVQPSRLACDDPDALEALRKDAGLKLTTSSTDLWVVGPTTLAWMAGMKTRTTVCA